MLNSNIDLSFNIKKKIRQIAIDNVLIGGDSSVSFMQENENKAKPLIAIEIPYIFDTSYPEILKKAWQTENFENTFTKAINTQADIISIKFNVSENNIEQELPKIKLFLNKIKTETTKPILLRGANNTQIDKVLIPFLAKESPEKTIIAFADEDTYENIVPIVAKNNQILVLRTPIDINLAKELNILAIDKGMSPDRILIDPDMGGLGYGLDYGYSIIEKIKLAGFDGDTMLNMPIIAFIGEESYRAKEAKSNTFTENWGDFETRSSMWEIAGATAMISAGANIIVVWNPNSIDVLKGLA